VVFSYHKLGGIVLDNKIEKLLEKRIKNQTEIIKMLKQIIKNQEKKTASIVLDLKTSQNEEIDIDSVMSSFADSLKKSISNI
jgi:hypothetical protein